jgi:hypothetical protein
VTPGNQPPPGETGPPAAAGQAAVPETPPPRRGGPGSVPAPAEPESYALPVIAWESAATGVLRLPSGRLVRGRALRRPLPAGHVPTFALHLLGRKPPPVPWAARWVRWPDFRLPSDRDDAAEALREAWARAEAERVEIACAGGLGRTGTALACLAVLDGLPGSQAVTYVREHYAARAVETPWQHRFVTRFPQP